MRTIPLALLLAACASQASPPADEPQAAPPVAEPEGAVRFSFAVNGLEHGNGAL